MDAFQRVARHSESVCSDPNAAAFIDLRVMRGLSPNLMNEAPDKPIQQTDSIVDGECIQNEQPEGSMGIESSSARRRPPKTMRGGGQGTPLLPALEEGVLSQFFDG